MDFITTLLEFPEMVLTQKHNKLLFLVYQIVVTMTKCQKSKFVYKKTRIMTWTRQNWVAKSEHTLDKG